MGVSMVVVGERPKRWLPPDPCDRTPASNTDIPHQLSLNLMLQHPVRAEGLLLKECRGGDAAAWRELHLQYLPITEAFLRKLGVREEDLSDAAQEVFLQMFRSLPRFREEARLQTWLYRLCITQARTLRRRLRVSRGLSALLLAFPEAHPVASPAFSESRVLVRLRAVLEQLPVRQREAFVLYEMEDQPGKVVAELLQCTEASVWRRLHHARQALRSALVSGGPALDKSSSSPSAYHR